MGLRKYKKRKRKISRNIVLALVIVISLIVIAHQAISDIIAKNWIGGLNYQGLPVDASLQLIVLGVILVVVFISLWEFFFKKKKTKK